MSKKRITSISSKYLSLKHKKYSQLMSTGDTSVPIIDMNSRLLKQTKCKTLPMNQDTLERDQIYNKNISIFKDCSTKASPNFLPFLSTLRKNSTNSKKPFSPTTIMPFIAARQTSSQTTKKKILDINGNSFRLSKMQYIWNKHSNAAIKAMCQFQCSLRMSCNKDNKADANLYRPVNPCLIDKKKYKKQDLICNKQNKLFTLQD